MIQQPGSDTTAALPAGPMVLEVIKPVSPEDAVTESLPDLVSMIAATSANGTFLETGRQSPPPLKVISKYEGYDWPPNRKNFQVDGFHPPTSAPTSNAEIEPQGLILTTMSHPKNLTCWVEDVDPPAPLMEPKPGSLLFQDVDSGSEGLQLFRKWCGKRTGTRSNGDNLLILHKTGSKVEPFRDKLQALKLDFLGDLGPLYVATVVFKACSLSDDRAALIICSHPGGSMGLQSIAPFELTLPYDRASSSRARMPFDPGGLNQETRKSMVYGMSLRKG
jgi:hypothetical protein